MDWNHREKLAAADVIAAARQIIENAPVPLHRVNPEDFARLANKLADLDKQTQRKTLTRE